MRQIKAMHQCAVLLAEAWRTDMRLPAGAAKAGSVTRDAAGVYFASPVYALATGVNRRQRKGRY
jgi:hypothetical protein